MANFVFLNCWVENGCAEQITEISKIVQLWNSIFKQYLNKSQSQDF